MATKPLIEKAENIKLNNSDEIDQILGNPPNWLLRWGITIIFLTVLIFAWLAWLIKYPDVIPTKITIITEKPVIQVIARASGKIDSLFIHNNQEVNKGDILARLDNPTSADDVIRLSHFLENIVIEKNEHTKIPVIPNLALGNLQGSYASLVQKINAYQYFLEQEDGIQKSKSLKAQIQYISELNTNLRKQQLTLLEEVNLSKKDLNRNKKLHLEKVISNVELERVETAFLQYKRQLEGVENQIISNNINIEQLQTQITEINQNRNNLQSEHELNIITNIEDLRSKIETWKESYLIVAPINGTISFSQIWSEQQFVNANQAIFTVVPNEKQGKVIGRAELPIANSGKVKIGQNINIQLDGFPFQEYGVIKAKVGGISLVPITSIEQKTTNYLVEVILPDNLVTTYSKTIPFRQKMEGTANIITEDRRILERVFDKLNNILKNT
ncbi:HlyD family secretion protein [Aureispira sp. CCB-QB1]|uniref:HlyD family secretion protein n=1 Tax=Aureispira sp. CCB-QB1 TaxID=1313421 RepID=UPI0006966C43|nr:HlyD family efflux transporter periplasmic adaptor subunit [Aureispira sp. CCB-QB1]